MRWDYRLVEMEKGHFEFREVFYEGEKIKGSCEPSLCFTDRYEAYALIDKLADAMSKEYLHQKDFTNEEAGATFTA